MISAEKIANYFLSLVQEDEGDLMSNLKLQKLLYYAQGFHLAMFNKPLFPESIEAWIHGPVVPDIYHKYKKHGREPISYKGNHDFSKISFETKALLDDIYQVYGQFSASALRNLTHSEQPWKSAEAQENKVISHDSLKAYFKTRLIDGKE